MAMTLASSGLTRSGIDKQIAALESKKVEIEQAGLAERHKAACALWPTLSMNHEPRLHELEAKIKVHSSPGGDPEALILYRTEYNKLNATRQALALELTPKRNQCRAEILATSPPKIDAAIADLQEQIVDVEPNRKTKLGDRDTGRHFSNVPAIDAFVAAARDAIRQLGELKYVHLDDADLTKSISQILKKIPKVDLTLREVTK